MDKKGAINLSINMIIVLIIAIIILGFALSFITGMFRKAEVSLTGQFPEPEVTVTRSNPIGIGSDFLLESGETRRMTLKVLNTHQDNLYVDPASLSTNDHDINFTCQGGDAPVIDAMEPIQQLAPGKTTSIKLVIRGVSGMQNNDICTIHVGTTDQPTNVISGDTNFAGRVSQTFFLNTD